jgi:hypothetical protein
MSEAILGSGSGGHDDSALAEAWTWWRRRRLAFNLGMAICGWLAYGLNAAIFYLGFHRPIWFSLRGGLTMTLVLGALFLLVMGAANICFLLGPVGETWVKPADRPAWRHVTWGLGLGAALAIPFLFPLANLALLISRTRV